MLINNIQQNYLNMQLRVRELEYTTFFQISYQNIVIPDALMIAAHIMHINKNNANILEPTIPTRLQLVLL